MLFLCVFSPKILRLLLSAMSQCSMVPHEGFPLILFRCALLFAFALGHFRIGDAYSLCSFCMLATFKAMNSTKIAPEQRNELRELLCGCVWTQKRQFDCQRAETLLCPCCVEEPEDEEHILWRCPRWEMLRRE